MTRLILAGDVGGTKTWLGLFSPDAARPTPLESRRYRTADFDRLSAVIDRFLEETGARGRVTDAAFGVAGPVEDNASDLTNVPWRVDGTRLGRELGVGTARVLNDLAAMAHALPALGGDELQRLLPGTAPAGPMAVIAPGTHLGEASLHAIGDRRVPISTEAGHAGFAARTPRELELVGALLPELGRVAGGDILSGPGLLRLHAFTHGASRCRACGPDGVPGEATQVTTAALDGACVGCVDALEIFVEALGAACGDLALRTMATGGVFIGGGIAPAILPALRAPRFGDAFHDKGPMRALVGRIPVSVILEPRAALLGAAVAAA